MNDAAFQQRELTLMFTDIVGYSRLMGRDQVQTIAMLEDYRRILLEQIDKQQGTVIEFIGDAVFARFDTPQAAVTAAVGIQKELFTFNHFRDKSLPRLQTRIGLHSSEVTTKGNAVFGDGVNIAARLEPIAVADSICISQAVYDAVKGELKEPVLSLGVQPLKNIESKVRAYLVRPLGITFKTRAHYFNRKLNQKLGAYRYPIAAAVVLVIISLFYWVPRWLVPGYDANYVEIADFQNLMNAGGEVDYLSAGITEAVRSQLADVRDVYLVKSGEGILAPIILEGSVQKVGNNLRIAYQLLRRKGNVQIAGGKLDGNFNEIFVLQDRLVGEIARFLADEFGIPNFRPSMPTITDNITAYDYYLRGRALLDSVLLGHDNYDQAANLFSTALVHDENFALAYAGKCEAYWRKHLLTNDSAWLGKAETHCLEALEVDSDSAEALESLARIYLRRGSPRLALDYMQRAKQFAPQKSTIMEGLASIYGALGQKTKADEIFRSTIKAYPKNWELYQEYGTFLFHQGDYEHALEMYMQVLEITPENIIAQNGIGGIYVYTGRFDKAADAFRKSSRLDPTAFNFSNTGTLYYLTGKFQLAIEMYKNAVHLEPKDFRWYLHLAEAQRQLDKKNGEAEKNYIKSAELANHILNKNPNDVSVYQYLAVSSFFAGGRDRAYEYIRKAKDLDKNNLETKFIELRFACVEGEMAKAIDLARNLLSEGYSKKMLVSDPDVGVIKSLLYDS